MPLQVTYITHSTTTDNEEGRASGHADVDLSARDEQQTAAIGARLDATSFDRIVCSDLRRSWRTAQIAFGDDVELLRDARLRECDYGALT